MGLIKNDFRVIAADEQAIRAAGRTKPDSEGKHGAFMLMNFYDATNRVCLYHKLIRKKEKTVPFFDDRKISNTNAVRDDKVDDLYGFCMDTEEEDRKVRMELLVNNIIASMTDTCKNILHSYYWDDFSTSTIADMFNFSNADSVKTQKYKCMNKFRDKYNELKGKIYG